MRLRDLFALSTTAIVRYPLRTSMLLVATAIGVSAVLVLTSLGEGGRRFVTGQFQSLGANLLFVLPGKNEVSGSGLPGAIGGSTRDLTLDDAIAISTSRYIARVAPVVPGAAAVEYQGLVRDVDILGTSTDMALIQRFELAAGKFLPRNDLDRAASVCVVGHNLVQEMFRGRNPVGEWVRVGDRRFRVIGYMRQSGIFGGVNVDEAIFIPVASAMQLFNTEGIFRLIVEANSEDTTHLARRDIIETVKARHYGNDDVTVIAQDAILSTFNTIFGAISAALGGIAAISLAVAGTLIMNVMLVAVSQRTEEIGLFKALGAKRRQIIGLFMTEAALLSLLGAVVGLLCGQAAIIALRRIYPIVDFQAPPWAIAAAMLTALACGLIFGIMPARRAANLDPVKALMGH